MSNIDTSNSINDVDKDKISSTQPPIPVTNNDDKAKTATLRQLFSEADSYDITLMTIGTVAALGTGITHHH